MNQHIPPEFPYRGNKAITVLRVVVWLIPAFLLPFSIALAAWLQNYWLLAIIPTLAAFSALGYFDMRLKLQQEQLDPSKEKESILHCTLIFAIAQLIIAPAVAFTVLGGICAASGIGFR